MLSNCTAITDSACPRWRIRKLASKEMIYKDVAKGSDFWTIHILEQIEAY
jgi:hypothetical protein